MARTCPGCAANVPQPSSGWRKWCSDWCRKQTLYGGTCADCGAPTNGSNGVVGQPKRCGPCRRRAQHEERHWTRETILGAIREWAAMRNGKPPSAKDWQRLHGREHPYTSVVQREFPSWADAIEAAGFPRPRTGHRGGRLGDDPAFRERVVALYLTGMTTAKVGDEVGLSPQGVLHHLVEAGIPRRGRWG